MKLLQSLCFLTLAAASLVGCGKSGDASKSSTTSVASTSSSVAECDAYVERVNKCMDKLGANSPMAATYKQQMDSAKTQWATMQDKSALANACKQANTAFDQSAQMLKCE